MVLLLTILLHKLPLKFSKEDITDLELRLVEGARNDDPNPEPPPNSPQHEEHPHQEHPHENKEHSDQPNGGRPGQHTDNPFGDYSGKTVKYRERSCVNHARLLIWTYLQQMKMKSVVEKCWVKSKLVVQTEPFPLMFL